MGLESFKNITFSEPALVGVRAALAAGELLRKGFGTHFTIHSKPGKHNLVTEYDHLSEKLIIDFIKKHYPDDTFLAEEGGKVGSNDEVLEWVIDPLDGTVNFAHGIPMFAVTLAARKKGEILFGIVYQPLTEELFVAELGVGSFCNGKKLQVTEVKDVKKSILATGFPYNISENPNHCIDHFIDILRLGIPIRRLGVAAIDLAYVAAGRFDAFFEVMLAPWDLAAGKLLVELAGGTVTSWEGKPFSIDSYSPLLASNTHIHHELLKILSRKI